MTPQEKLDELTGIFKDEATRINAGLKVLGNDVSDLLTEVANLRSVLYTPEQIKAATSIFEHLNALKVPEPIVVPVQEEELEPEPKHPHKPAATPHDTSAKKHG